MLPTLIKTLTASNSASLEFVDGTSSVVLDDTYDEYMFVWYDINPNDDDVNFTFQVNATDDAGGGYDTSVFTTGYFAAEHTEADATDFPNAGDHDMAQSNGRPTLANGVGNGSDESCAGIMHIYGISSSTFVKHFTTRSSVYGADSSIRDVFGAGYINDTTPIDEFHFQVQGGGNFDGVIQLYGIA